MNRHINSISLILFLAHLSSTASWAVTLASNKTLYGNTNKEFTFDYFLYNKNYRNDLFYTDLQIHGIVQPAFTWPTSMKTRIGGGYRWLNHANQMRGIYCFYEESVDLSSLGSHDRKNALYYRGFSRFNIGYEHDMNPIGITINTYIPKKALHETLDHQYLDSSNFEGGAYEESMAPLYRNTGLDPVAEKDKMLTIRKNNFFYQNGKRYQKCFYLTEGSYGMDAKLTYNWIQYNTLPFGGLYYFRDSYANNIIGLGVGFEYKPNAAFSADFKYTYDKLHSHYIALGVKLTTSDYHPRRSNQLLKPVETGLAPLLKRNQAPREVFNTYREKLANNMGIDPTLPLEGVKREIKSGYRTFILKHHPDKNNDKNPQQFQEQNEQWEQLRGGYGLIDTD